MSIFLGGGGGGCVYKILLVTDGQSHSVEHERQTGLRVICRVPRERVADCVAMWPDPALLEPVMRSKIPDIEVHEHSTVVGFSHQEFSRPISCADHVK
jgi:hypothetical protein